MQIRDIMDLVEGLLSEAFKLSYAHGFRSWYNPATKTWHNVALSGFNCHGREVAKNPEFFGVDPTVAAGINAKSTEGEQALTDLAKAQGWIRVAGESRNNPDQGMIFEGDDLKALVKVAKMFWHDQGGELKAVMLKCDGQEYVMIGAQAIKAGVMQGQLPAPVAAPTVDA